MQRHQVQSTCGFAALVFPPLGWILAASQTLPKGQRWKPMLDATFAAPWRHGWLVLGLLCGIGLAVLICYWVTHFEDDGFRGARYWRWLRGARMKNWHAVRSMVRSRNRRENRNERKAAKKEGRAWTDLTPIMVGPMPMPIHLENRHTLISASIGTGKSVTIEGMIRSAVLRRDKLAVVDPNGGFYAKFGLPGDVILNPFDRRTAGWSLFNEIKSVHDFDRVAKSVIPPQIGEHEQWCGYARDVLADAMRKLMAQGNPSTDALVNLLLREDGEAIRQFLSDTDSAGYFRENAEKALASVQFLMTTYVRPLRFMGEGDFSLHRWVHDPDAGNLYITWREDMRAAQRPLVATWIDTICATILSYEPMSGKRLWLFLDELESLGKLESFVPATTKGRKHGLRIVGSIQDWAQLDENYGKEAARVLVSCFRSYVILAAANAQTAERASEVLGEHEVERWRFTYSDGGKRSKALGHERERLVLPSEIANLPDLSGYVMFAEEFPVARFSMQYEQLTTRNAAIELRPA